jgi:DNA-directed RNA polymerase subunit RPC12/RpoP|tara:strand:+ start:3998 stop:4231 length:234 start_codon:yes stop_codon:yes gene_type:complete
MLNAFLQEYSNVIVVIINSQVGPIIPQRWSKMVNYKCASCGTKLDMDLEVLGLTCRVCGEKIFYKIRPSTKKTVISD